MLSGFRSNKPEHVAELMVALEKLVDRAAEERQATERLMTQLEPRRDELARLNQSIHTVQGQLSGFTKDSAELNQTLDRLREKVQATDQIERRVDVLQSRADKLDALNERMGALEVDLRRYQTLLQQLRGEEAQVRTNIESLKGAHGGLNEVREELLRTHSEMSEWLVQMKIVKTNLGDQMSALRTDLSGQMLTVKTELDDQMRTVKVELGEEMRFARSEVSEQMRTVKTELAEMRSSSGQLSLDFARLYEQSRDARQNMDTAADLVKQVEQKLTVIGTAQEVGRAVEERLGVLGTLAESVARKTELVEQQRHTVEHALAESNRVAEMVRQIELEASRLSEGIKGVKGAEARIEQLDRLERDLVAQLQTAAKAKEGLGHDLAKLDADRAGIDGTLRLFEERQTVLRTSFESFDLRQQTVHGRIGDLDKQVDALLTKQRQLTTVAQDVDIIMRRVQSLESEMGDLEKQKVAIASITAKVTELDDLGRNALRQAEQVTAGRSAIDELQRELGRVQEKHTDILKLRDTLDEDRLMLKGFVERLEAFSVTMPELDAKVQTVNGKLGVIEQPLQRATALVALADDLEQRIPRLLVHQQLIDRIEGRLNGLHGLADEVDAKVREQISRRHDVESLHNSCDSLTIRVAEMQQRLQSMSAAQGKLGSLSDEVPTLKNDIDRIRLRLGDLQREGDQIVEQEKRLAKLTSQSRSLNDDVEKRLKQVENLCEDLARASTAKDDYREEIGRLHSRQNEMVGHLALSEEQLKRLEAMCRQLENRYAHLVFMEKRLGTIEGRVGEIRDVGDDLERMIQSLQVQRGVVEGVRNELGTIHDIAGRTRTDLEYLADHRADTMAARTRLDQLLSVVNDVNAKVEGIESRNVMIDEVFAKSSVVAAALEETRTKLQQVAEQKVLVDRASEQVASLDTMLQESERVLRNLERERQVAERISETTRQLQQRAEGLAGRKLA